MIRHWWPVCLVYGLAVLPCLSHAYEQSWPSPPEILVRECSSTPEIIGKVQALQRQLDCNATPYCSAALIDVVIVEDPIPNAFMSGNRRLILTSSLATMIESSEELAFIIAHELSHQILGHTSLSSHDEFEADDLARIMLISQGYDVHAGARLLNRIANTELVSTVQLGELFPTLRQRSLRL